MRRDAKHYQIIGDQPAAKSRQQIAQRFNLPNVRAVGIAAGYFDALVEEAAHNIEAPRGESLTDNR